MYVSDGEENVDRDDVLETRNRARTLPGYSSDGRCGPSHKGLMCDPDSTVYTVSKPTASLLSPYLSSDTGNLLLRKCI